MSLCKICPACGEKNDPRSMECVKCSYDLMSTPMIDPEIVDSNQEGEQGKEHEVRQDTPKELVRICPCGAVNPPQMRKCQTCHEDISDILPVPRPITQEGKFVLEEYNTHSVFPVPCGTTVIGRESSMREALAGKSYVSRIHAKLIVENGKFYIENLSSTNYTYVNNEKIPEGRVELKRGDEVGLGGITVNGTRQEQAAYFLVGVMK